MAKSEDIREMLLTIIKEQLPKDQFDAELQAGSILDDAGRRLAGTNQKLILTRWTSRGTRWQKAKTFGKCCSQ